MTEGYKKMFWGAMFVSFAGVSGLVALLECQHFIRQLS